MCVGVCAHVSVLVCLLHIECKNIHFIKFRIHKLSFYLNKITQHYIMAYCYLRGIVLLNLIFK